jgi:hypothetical protein
VPALSTTSGRNEFWTDGQTLLRSHLQIHARCKNVRCDSSDTWLYQLSKLCHRAA